MNINERSQFKHLTAFILILLAEKDNSPRNIHSLLSKEFPGFKRDMTTVYRCLSSMEKEGLVKMEWELPQGGAARKLYSITENGMKDLKKWEEDIKIRKNNFETFLKKYKILKQGETICKN